MRQSPMLRTRQLFLPALLILAGVAGCSNQNGPEALGGIEQDTGAVIAGTVRGTDGRPAANAVITLESMVAGRAASVAARAGLTDLVGTAKSARVQTAVAGADGGYGFDDLAAGDYLLTTTLRDHAGASNRVDIGALAAAMAETTVVDIQLMPTGTILGSATRENATDHSGTVVFVDGTSYVAVTAAGGSYSLTGVPIGLRPVHATYPGYLDDATTATLTAAGDSTTASALFLRQSANMAPLVTTIGADSVPVGTPTSFAGDGYDPDGVVVLWEWDFQNDGVFDWSSGVNPSAQYTYPGVGQYLAKLRVTDNQGGYGLAVVEVTVFALPATAVFVSESGDDGNLGSAQQPVRTIAQGLALAQSAAIDSVLVTTGEYVGVINLVDGIGIYGGRDPVTWADTPGYSHVTGDTRLLRGTGITSATNIEGLHLESDDAAAPGAASVAVTLTNCSAQLVFTDCLITAGNGAPGLAGLTGNSGAPGGNGNLGLSGVCDSEPTRPGAFGGSGFFNGGSGGNGGNSGGNGANGGAGSTGGGGGGSGGNGGSTGDPGNSGGTGQAGLAGSSGAGGTTVSPSGQIVGGIWQPLTSNSGLAGGGGRGGGGGGGGGGQTGTFVIDGAGGAGGGGGGGGFPGQPGTGGQGGGASIGFLLDNATPLVVDCIVTTSSGGTGGQGGNGGAGGAGGVRGTGGGRDCPDVGFGGNGGNGGSGGSGGGGAGGPGGPSFGIAGVSGGLVADLTGITFVQGTGGSGGAGGAAGSSGQPGSPGTVANVAFF